MEKIKCNFALNVILMLLFYLLALPCLGQSLSSGKVDAVPTKCISMLPVREVIPQAEREALIDFYKATGGEHWASQKKWLLAPGTEIDWENVMVMPVKPSYLSFHVVGLDFYNNNLSGFIPESICNLPYLESLTILGENNHVSGKIPDCLLKKWDAGGFLLVIPNNFDNVASEIDLSNISTGLLCPHHKIILKKDGSAKLMTILCKTESGHERETFCEIKNGNIYNFGRLARFIDTQGFFSLKKSYEQNITHAGWVTISVIRANQETKIEDYGQVAPLALWSIEQAIEGAIQNVDWNETIRSDKCDAWP